MRKLFLVFPEMTICSFLTEFCILIITLNNVDLNNLSFLYNRTSILKYLRLFTLNMLNKNIISNTFLRKTIIIFMIKFRESKYLLII